MSTPHQPGSDRVAPATGPAEQAPSAPAQGDRPGGAPAPTPVPSQAEKSPATGAPAGQGGGAQPSTGPAKPTAAPAAGAAPAAPQSAPTGSGQSGAPAQPSAQRPEGGTAQPATPAPAAQPAKSAAPTQPAGPAPEPSKSAAPTPAPTAPTGQSKPAAAPAPQNGRTAGAQPPTQRPAEPVAGTQPPTAPTGRPTQQPPATGARPAAQPSGAVRPQGTAAAGTRPGAATGKGQTPPWQRGTQVNGGPAGQGTPGAVPPATRPPVGADQAARATQRETAKAKAAVIDGPTRHIDRTDLAKDLPDLSEVKHPIPAEPVHAPVSGKQPSLVVAATAPVGDPLRASVQIRKIDPWSALKVSLVLSVALFFVWMFAVGFLYLVLDGMGVWDRLNNAFTDIVSETGNSGLVTAGQVFGYSALIGVINVVLFTALATVGAFIYNLCTDLVGGVEVTLADRD
ncbi:hypothetical protein FK531_00990 [Rhodococcus spelaei]|uniref:DUF3566 domain-containing protein n=1 Tax=Rhodococcus spelaei TaxID=2546320 RepID=A0A541BQW6_9NOCA|nr:DUF3566 domain-containing protein [Rhodococcus spelaei]TQF74709.1 hypothetical protein FK531_00990 [Rhodococcus spelaei]